MEARMEEMTRKRPPRSYVSSEAARAYLAKTASDSPKAHILASFLSADPGIMEEALIKFPGDIDLQVAALLYDKRFLKNSEAIAALAKTPEAPQIAAFMAARAALEEKDPLAVSNFLKIAMAGDLQRYEQAYKKEWNQMSPALKPPDAGRNWAGNAGEILHGSSSDIIDEIILTVPGLLKSNSNNPDYLAMGGAVLALAEQRAEPSLSLVGERVALMNEMDVLSALGRKAAGNFLTVPFQQYWDDIERRREVLQIQINEFEAYKTTLAPEPKKNFEQLAEWMGDRVALESTRVK